MNLLPCRSVKIDRLRCLVDPLKAIGIWDFYMIQAIAFSRKLDAVPTKGSESEGNMVVDASQFSLAAWLTHCCKLFRIPEILRWLPSLLSGIIFI